MTMDTNGFLISGNKRTSKLESQAAALVIIDMQEYFRGIAAPVLPNILLLINKWRDAGLPLIFTQHGHKNSDEDRGMLARWWGDLIMEGTPSAEIMHELQPNSSGRVIRKDRYSAFHRTELHAYLQELGIRQLIIAGVMTNLCCETTARDAFVHDYEVFFLVDGTATVSDYYHRATLLNISFGCAHLKTCYDIISEIDQK